MKHFFRNELFSTFTQKKNVWDLFGSYQKETTTKTETVTEVRSAFQDTIWEPKEISNGMTKM